MYTHPVLRALSKVVRHLALLSCMGYLAACSTIVEGSDQTVTVLTQPSGATCELMRNGQTIGAVSPTPGSLVVEKSKHNISVLCRKHGFQDTGGTLASTFEGMTFGNILFGGLIGVAVDAASGAANEYPDSVTIVMLPDQFETSERRDTFFDERVSDISQKYAQARRDLKENCGRGDKEEDCDARMEELQDNLTTELAKIEEQRELAKVSE